MNDSKSSNDFPKESRKLRNFDLTVEEIRMLKAIKNINRSLEDIERKNIQSERLDFFVMKSESWKIS